MLRIVRAAHDEVTLPALILTATDNSGSDLLEALAAGANDFALKPCSEAELRARVATLVRVRLLHDRARRAEQKHEQALKELGERAAFEQQLIGIVSHDLRTPASAIALGAQLLAKDVTLSERQAKIAGRIASSSGRMSRMIRDLLDFTAVRHGHGLPIAIAKTDLHELASKVLSEVQVVHPERKIDLCNRGHTRGGWDADRVAQLMTNLITNAIQYSPSDRKVTVETSGDGVVATLTVHNEGSPIPEELLPKLFRPMQRGEDEHPSARGSVGLGLFIVQEITRAHGGQVEVRSTHAEGTTFVVRFPQAPVPSQVGAE